MLNATDARYALLFAPHRERCRYPAPLPRRQGAMFNTLTPEKHHAPGSWLGQSTRYVVQAFVRPYAGAIVKEPSAQRTKKSAKRCVKVRSEEQPRKRARV